MEQMYDRSHLQIALQPERVALDSPTLRFESDGTFQITIFSDLHLGEG